MFDLSVKFPEKPSETADLEEEEIKYTNQLLKNVGEDILNSSLSKLQKLYVHIKELLESDRLRKIWSKHDEEARFGHKSETSTFFGYKNHIAMTEERLITVIGVTSGEVSNGQMLKSLVEQSKSNGIEVKEVLADTAYSMTLIAKSNPVIASAAEQKNDSFKYNKDAGMMQCPAGELALTVHKRQGKYDNQ